MRIAALIGIILFIGMAPAAEEFMGVDAELQAPASILDISVSIGDVRLEPPDPSVSWMAGVSGVVVPHHLTAAPMIREVLSALDPSGYEGILLIGPDHRNTRDKIPVTTRARWLTAAGAVEADAPRIEQLLETGRVLEEASWIGAEHSIANLMPFIALYFPEIPVIPMILPGTLDPMETEQWGVTLAEITDNPRILVILSVDFAHDVSAETALAHHQIALEAMEAGNVYALMQMDDAFLDASQATVAFLRIMQERGTTEICDVKSGTARDFGAPDPSHTTGYMTMRFR